MPEASLAQVDAKKTFGTGSQQTKNRLKPAVLEVGG